MPGPDRSGRVFVGDSEAGVRAWGVTGAIVCVLACVLAPGLASADERAFGLSVAATIEQRLAKAVSGRAPVVAGVRFTTTEELARIYAGHAYAAVWRADRAAQLVEAVSHAELEGLLPDDYLASLLAMRLPDLASTDPVRVAEADLLLSESLARYVRHLLLGKVDPKSIEPTWNIPVDHELFPGSLRDAIESPDLGAWLASLTPDHFMYVGLRRMLARLRELESAGGWKSQKNGPNRKIGDADRRMPALRERLRMTGELAADAVVPADPDVFDEALGAAVARFRRTHGLSETAVLDAATVAALNVPVSKRIAQVRVNLDRGRAVLERLDRTFVVVNIAGFKLYVVRDGKVAWDTRVQVGRQLRETPIFRSEIAEVKFNPTWTVPPGIIAKDVLPEARAGHDVFAHKKVQVLAADGTVVDPATVDWSAFTARTLPYKLVQPPGDDNALGRLKFEFPNPYYVYMHDTPSTKLFEKNVRTFSSGCIRVEDPRTLATLLLDDPAWDRAAIDAAATGDRTRVVALKSPVPVLILYWTAAAAPDGSWRFYADPYQRDPKYLKALDKPFGRGR